MDEQTPTPDELELIPGTPEYDAAMAAKFDETQGTETEDKHVEDDADEGGEDRPSWLPEKFQSPEDLARAYEELQRKLSQGTKPDAKEPEQEDKARETVEAAGLDFDALQRSFIDNGGLTDEDYASLEKAGIPASMVDTYVEGLAALQSQRQAEVFATVGGEEVYREVAEWAATSLSPEEIDAFNAVVDTGDLNAVKLAVAGLKSRYETAVGSQPNLVTSKTGTTSGEVFRSVAQLTAAMKDPRYKTDPAYREEVQQKLARSNIM